MSLQGYRVSAEQQISAALLAENGQEKPDLEMLRDAATSIYNQYLSEKVGALAKSSAIAVYFYLSTLVCLIV